jgi:heptosyltransferase-2
MWDPSRFAALADALADSHAAQIIINAAPNERAVAAQVAAGMCHPPLLNFADLDNSLALLKAMLARCDLLVTNDTGARHVAAAVGAAVVTVFGSTDPRWAAIDYPLEEIVRVDVPCSPCQRKLCGAAPGPAYHRCMQAITPEMVIAPARRWLDQARSRGRS